MNSREFADQVTNIVTALRHRIIGIGTDQYEQPDGTQRFETRPIEQIVIDALEEVDDLIVYAAQLRIRLEDLQRTLANPR